MNGFRRHLAVALITLLGILLLIAVIFLAPYLKNRGFQFSVFLYSVTSTICHQAPERCFHVWNSPLAVCSRCLGIYAGFLLGTLVYPFIHGFSHTRLPRIESLFLLTLPIGIDAIGNFFHLWNSPGWLRFAVGICWGVLLPYFFIPGMVDAVQIRQKHG